jgi:putative transcriptional regulator
MTKRYRSKAMASIHETMESLYKIGTIDKKTMRRFDEACLTPVHHLTPEDILIIRYTEKGKPPQKKI